MEGMQLITWARSIFGHVGSGGVPEFDPEGSCRAVNGERRTVDHYGNRFGDRSRAQLFEEFRYEGFEFSN